MRSGTEQDVVITVAEGGGIFAVAQETGQFLWARPFPYDDPNINMNVVDVKTGRTSVNPEKLFKKDGDTILGCYHNTRGLWQIAYHPGKNSLYVPFHDQCLTMQAVNSSATGYGQRVASGVRLRPQGLHELAKVESQRARCGDLLAAQLPRVGAVDCGRLLFFGDLNLSARPRADNGKVLWKPCRGMIINSNLLCRHRQAIRLCTRRRTVVKVDDHRGCHAAGRVGQARSSLRSALACAKNDQHD